MSTRIEVTWTFKRHKNPEKSHLQYIKRNTNTHYFFFRKKMWRLNCLESELVAKIANKNYPKIMGKIHRFPPFLTQDAEKSFLASTIMYLQHTGFMSNFRSGDIKLTWETSWLQLYNPIQLIHINITRTKYVLKYIYVQIAFRLFYKTVAWRAVTHSSPTTSKLIIYHSLPHVIINPWNH